MILDIDIHPTHHKNGRYYQIVMRTHGAKSVHVSVGITQDMSKKEFAKIEKQIIKMISKIKKPKKWS